MQAANQDNIMEQLPDDMLANVLGRLPPSSLAASRCVRKHWCSIIDARRLLRADLLPLHLDAFFINPSDLESHPSFFARPSTKRRITGRLLFWEEELPYLSIEDHCNGLLLRWDMVVNPATRQWAELPPFPEPVTPIGTIPIEENDLYPCFYLVYDPMVSPQHYEVFLFPWLLHLNSTGDVIKYLESEWPPSSYTTHVFSSRKWRWEERSFVRQGEPAGTLADCRCRTDRWTYDRQAVYFRGALYVYCQNNSVMRIILSDDKYQMIKSPVAATKLGTYIGKSEKGVYYVLLDWEDDRGPQFQVWLLNELCGQMEWVLKSNISLQAVVENFSRRDIVDPYSRPWIQNFDGKEEPTQDGLDEWDFDNGTVLKATDNKANKTRWSPHIVFLGFHPYKEIAFFCISSRAVSYHLNSSKVQELGFLRITEMENSFPYTACWMGELFENN